MARINLRTMGVLLVLAGILTALGACGRGDKEAEAAAQVVTPPGGPRFVLQIPAEFKGDEDMARDALGRAWLALHDQYQLAPPLQWQIIFETTPLPGFPDLPSAPVYVGNGTLRMSVDYLRPPAEDRNWINAQMLGVMEGLAEVFNDYLGLGKTEVGMGLAVLMARNVAPGMWAGMRAAEMNTYIINCQDVEYRNVQAWLQSGKLPEGGDERVLDRQRQLLLWNDISSAGFADMWPRLFRDLQRGLPLTKVASPAEGNRELIKALRRVTKTDCTKYFTRYGFQT